MKQLNLDKPKQYFYWRCMKCGMAYDLKPSKCTRCGNSKFAKSPE